MTEYIMDRSYDILNGAYSFIKREKIVRCEDCKFFDTKQCKSQWPFRLDGFCAWAERRQQ
jgi:hypothetical protein